MSDPEQLELDIEEVTESNNGLIPVDKATELASEGIDPYSVSDCFDSSIYFNQHS